MNSYEFFREHHNCYTEKNDSNLGMIGSISLIYGQCLRATEIVLLRARLFACILFLFVFLTA